MKLNREEVLKKKILDAQEMVRDYEVHSKAFEDIEMSKLFKKFAKESAYQAEQLKDLLKRIEKE